MEEPKPTVESLEAKIVLLTKEILRLSEELRAMEEMKRRTEEHELIFLLLHQALRNEGQQKTPFGGLFWVKVGKVMRILSSQ